MAKQSGFKKVFMGIKRVHLLITGEVTGVGFRLFTVYMARDLGLTGWVRNLENDRVEIVAEGSKEKLENLIVWSREGPPLARVEKVDVEWGEVTGEFKGFGVRK